MSRSSRRRKRLERRKRQYRHDVGMLEIGMRFLEQYEVSQPVVRQFAPPPAIPCAICIRMVAETCRARGRCLYDDYLKGVIARQPGVEPFNWYTDQNAEPERHDL